MAGRGLPNQAVRRPRTALASLRRRSASPSITKAAARALERDEKVDVIVAISTTTARAVKRATTKIPIVFAAL